MSDSDSGDAASGVSVYLTDVSVDSDDTDDDVADNDLGSVSVGLPSWSNGFGRQLAYYCNLAILKFTGSSPAQALALNRKKLAVSYRDDEETVCSRTYRNIKVSVVKDDIANQQVDVIVNSTVKNLNLKDGAVSRSLLQKGGTSIQDECRTKYPNGLSTDEIAATGAGSLHCQQIYHACLPVWNGGKNKPAVQKLVLKCLSEASKSGHTSIAFPALGTGFLGYNKEYVAKSMFESMERFGLENKTSSVTSVMFVIHPADAATLQAFKAANNKRGVDTSSRTVCDVKIGRMTVNLTIGQLYDQQSDVVMTTSTRGLDLQRGTLSNSVLEAAGPALQAECASKYPNGIQHGEVAILGPANVSCKHIYCGALPRLDKPQGSDPKQLLSTLVSACLQQASTDKMSSICFPALGTGYLMYPPTVSASITLRAIRDFATTNNASSLNTVKIVIGALSSSIQKSLQPFKSECETYTSKLPPPVAPKPYIKRKQPVRSTPLPVPKPRAKPKSPGRGTPEFCLHMYSCDIYPPPYWTVFTSNKNVKQWKIEQKGKPAYTLVDVDQSTFKSVEQLVLSTWEPAKLGQGRDAKGISDLSITSLKVTKVQRVENLTLYEQYCQSRQQMFHKAAEGSMFDKLSSIPGVKHGGCNVEKYLDVSLKGTLYPEVNEGYFFHGTKKDVAQGVLTHGLDIRMAHVDAVLGQAIYMAESSTKADQYTDPRGKRQKDGLQMFLVKSSLGKICLMKGVSKLRRAPCCEDGCHDDGCHHDKRYDSIVAEEQYIFREFVVYNSYQVYPEFIITYNRV